MSRRHPRECGRRLEIVLLHLLKWRYQPERRSPSWRRTLLEQRHQLTHLLQRYPRLRPQVPAMLTQRYRTARLAGLRETGRLEEAIPRACPWTVEQILDPDFWPDG